MRSNVGGDGERSTRVERGLDVLPSQGRGKKRDGLRSFYPKQKKTPKKNLPSRRSEATEKKRERGEGVIAYYSPDPGGVENRRAIRADGSDWGETRTNKFLARRNMSSS